MKVDMNMSNEKEKNIPSLKELVKMNEELLKIISDLKTRVEVLEKGHPISAITKPKIVLKD
jgi:hypothetical protein